ncbi:argininosuccinate lyase [Candidatus Neomarinimicrobiota bacterium]
MAKQIWSSRTGVELDPAINELNQSLKFDYRLQPYDMELSLVWAGALEQCGAITHDDLEDIQAGFGQISKEWDQGMPALDGDEDIHMYHERRLTELIGDAGKKLHRGRSRNDQVATGLRLYVRARATELETNLRQVIGILCAKADEHKDWPFPGHTHMQQAQVVSLGHLLAAQAWKLKGDVESMDLVRRSIAECPLGSGALAGTSLAVDREWIAKGLGFNRASQNSVEAVTSRDFVLDMTYVLARLGVHLSQLAEDMILWCSQEFGYAKLGSSTVTGSSLLPHKQNPDVFELARGKAGRLTGNVTGLLAMLKGLPGGYNKDLQEDKEALFDSVETVAGLLPAVDAALKGLSFNREHIESKISAALKSERITQYLIDKGAAFREAYQQAGSLVKHSDELDIPLDQLTAAQIDAVLSDNGKGLQEVLAVGWSVPPDGVVGGSSVASVEKQVETLKEWFD